MCDEPLARSAVSPPQRAKNGILLKFRTLLGFLGPAFVVSVAYIDPGNFATNISGGSLFNYNLLWVVLYSNVMAIFLQSLSAKLGIATGRNLPQMCGAVFSRATNWVFWVAGELMAMATDLAEFLGATLGFTLLFHIPVAWAGVLTALITFALVYLGRFGQKVTECVIAFFVAIICGAYALELFLAKPDWAMAGLHVLVPSLPNGKAVLIAVGMLGATVMPHVIFLHSQLVQHRNGAHTDQQRQRHLKWEKIDIVIAMNIAFVVNAAMIVVSAAVFYKSGIAVTTIEQAHHSLAPLLGAASSGAFGLALIASGLSSSAVGTMAGQTVMQGFLGLKISDNATRIVTMLPAMAILLIGINPMDALVMSQVILSFFLPFAVIPLLLITRRKDVMGRFANTPLVNAIGVLVSFVILAANVVLLGMTLLGKV